MFNNPYMYTRFTPNFSMGMMPVRGISASRPMAMNAIRGASMRIPNMGMTRGVASSGFFSRLGGFFSSLRGVNWGGLINNTSKTIGVINQTLPLVKQVGPMVRNMKSVMKIASVFKDETDPVSNSISKNTSVTINNRNSNNNAFNGHAIQDNKKEILPISISDNNENINSNSNLDNSPIFFIN